MALKGKQVLIIDDSEDVRIIARKILENLGLIVTEASSVDMALKIIETRIPHLIILDLEMPGKSGFDFLGIRSQMPKLQGVPVIVTSAHNDRALVHRAVSLGADNYILKPINSAVLGQRVRKHSRSLDYMHYEFTDNQPQVTLLVKAQITGIGDTNFILGSPVRIARGSSVTIVPPLIGKVSVKDYVLKSGVDTVGRSLSGRYLTKINLIGLKETLSKQLKKSGEL